MNITDINDIILGNVILPKRVNIKDLPDYTKDIEEAIEMCEGLYNKEHLTLTRSHTEFYDYNPLMNAAITDWKVNDSLVFKKELFYSMLCGVYIPNVPSELTALFVLTRRECEYPNQMIAALDKSAFKKYLTYSYHSSPTIMKDILDGLWGYKVNLVTNDRLMVTNDDAVEIYIRNINDILLCNKNIRDILPDTRDVENLKYSKEKGIVLGDSDIPLRTLVQTFGIVDDDLDLRKVFLVNGS